MNTEINESEKRNNRCGSVAHFASRSISVKPRD